MRRAAMDPDGFGATPRRPQLRLLGLLVITLALLPLLFLGLWATVNPALAGAATLTVLMGTVGLFLSVATGLTTVDIRRPFSQTETGRIIATVVFGLAACLVIEWAVVSIFPLQVLVPGALVYSSVALMGFVVVVAVAPFEELFMSFIQTLFTQTNPRSGAVFGIGSRAIIFGVFHFRAYQLSPAFWAMIGVGAVIGVAFYATPYLEVPILIHTTLNLLSVIPLCWALGWALFGGVVP